MRDDDLMPRQIERVARCSSSNINKNRHKVLIGPALACFRSMQGLLPSNFVDEKAKNSATNIAMNKFYLNSQARSHLLFPFTPIQIPRSVIWAVAGHSLQPRL